MSISHALAIAEPPARRPALYGTRAQLAAPGGDVEGYLTLAACDRRAGTASYALCISNGSEFPLRARMSCLQLRGGAILAYPLDVHVAPFSRCQTLLPVRMDQVGRFDRAVVEVSGGSIAFTLEAPAPSRQPRRIPWLAASASALALTFGAAFAAAAATPRMGVLATPQRVFAGAPVEVPYAFGGWASLEYALRTSDGRQLAAGIATTHEGTLRFNVPASAGKDVVLNVNVSGPFGKKSSLQHITIAGLTPVAVKAPPEAPHIGEFAVTTASAHAGGEISFAYSTNAQDGEIWLIDESGRLWAKTPVSVSGTATMSVPQGTAGRSMRAVLHARNGALDTVASIAITILPGAVVQAPDVSAKPVNAPPQAATLTLSTLVATPGQTVTVALGGPHGDANVSLNDASGTSVAQGDIAAGQDALALTAPNVTTATTYYVTVNVTDGAGAQTLVKKLTVRPLK